MHQRLLPLHPGLHLSRREGIDAGRLPGLPPVGFDLPELLLRRGVLAAEFACLLLQRKSLRLECRPIGHAVCLAAQSIGQVVGATHRLLIAGRQVIRIGGGNPSPSFQGRRSQVRRFLAGRTRRSVRQFSSTTRSPAPPRQELLQGCRVERFLSPILQDEPPAGIAECAGIGQFSLRRRLAPQPQPLQFAIDDGRFAAGLFQLCQCACDRRLGLGEAAIEAGNCLRRRQGQSFQAFQRSAPQPELAGIDCGLSGECGNLRMQGGGLLRKIALVAGLADGLGQGRRVGGRRQLRQLLHRLGEAPTAVGNIASGLDQLLVEGFLAAAQGLDFHLLPAG